MQKRFSYLITIFLFINSLIFCKNVSNLTLDENLIKGSLSNGLQYYILKNKKPEHRASLNLIVKAGSLLEEENQQGLAHFLEHMAFNGTKKYKKNELVKYLQSLGLSFGGDLNAYTSFSETVYKLQVPTTNKDLNVAFDVFKEWMSSLTLNPKDIDEEKNIIIEEWRLTQGINQRIGDLQKKIIYGDSRYSKRFPIGKLQMIKSANHKKLYDFYSKWYQPKNMAIVIVGDFNPNYVENLIKHNFSQLKNTNNVDIKTYKINSSSNNSITLFTDAELVTTTFDIMWKNEIKPITTESILKYELIKELLNSILNTRFSIISKENNAPFIFANSSNFSLNKHTGIYSISALVKNEDVNKTIDTTLTNLKEIALNGVDEEELNKEKIDILNTMQTLINNKDSIKNTTYANSINNYVLKDNTFMNIETEYDITKKLFKSIKSSDLKKYAHNILSKNYDILITSRENLKNKLPTKMEIQNVVNNVLNKKDIFQKKQYYSTKLDKFSFVSGTTTKISNNKYFKRYKLSNGIEVFYKKTDFEKDKINFQLIKPRGSSQLNYSEYINSKFLPYVLINSGVANINYSSLNLYLKGKNFNIQPFINDYTKGFYISTNKKDLDESLNYFKAMITKPRIDNTIIKTILDTNKEMIKNSIFSPQYNLKKLYLETLTNNNPRRVPIKLKDLDYVNQNALKSLFDKLYTNFYDYKLLVVGSIDEKTLIEKLNYYFANLPTKYNLDNFKKIQVNYPAGSIHKTIVKGIDKKATVILTFPYKSSFSIKNQTLYKSFSSLLNILLIEEIRENIGGVYSIASYANINKMNYGENYLQIAFNCDAKRVDKIVSKIKEVIKNVQSGSFNNNKILDIQKNYKLTLDTALKTNNFWEEYLNENILTPNYKFYTSSIYNDIVTTKSITKFSNEALNISNCIEIVLLPEKED